MKDRTIEKLYESFRSKFNHTITLAEEEGPLVSEVSPTAELSLDHGRVKELVFEIGKLNRFISEKEYPMGSERLDVVWRRIEGSVPTYVFEIQFGGDVYHALGKLKHAFDLWNSNIFLIAREQDMQDAERLLSGTFHEIQGKIKRITSQKVYELYERKRQWIELEREIGLL